MSTTLGGPEPSLGPETSAVPELNNLQLGHLRHIENLAWQPDGDWSHMGGSDPGQEWFDSYRYQLAQMAYALGLAHFHWLPAAPGVFKPTFERLIHKMLRRDVWGYWKETSRGSITGDPDLDISELREPWTDPVVKENIMYSGHLYAMVAMHAALFDDDKYDEPGALTFEWRPFFQGIHPEIHEYQRSTVGEAIYWQMVENGWLGVACEPNCVFIVCNQFPMLGFRFEDLRNGTKRAQEATASYQAAWERKGLLDGNGYYPLWWYIRQDSLMPADGIDTIAWANAVLNSWNPGLVRDVYERQLRGWFKPGPAGTLSLNGPSVAAAIRQAQAAGEPVGELATDDYRADPTFGYVAMLLSEMGDERLDGLLAHADRFMNPTWERGGLYYPRNDARFDDAGNLTYMDPLTGNALLAYARLNVPDGLWAMYNRPWGPEHHQQPQLSGIDGPVDVTRAWYDSDSHTLLLTLQPRSDMAETTLEVANIPSNCGWSLRCNGAATVSSDEPHRAPGMHLEPDGDPFIIRTSISEPTTIALRWSRI